jgi:hypothetical protein
MFKTMLDAFRTLVSISIILLLLYIALTWAGITLKIFFCVIGFFSACGFIMWCFEGLSKNGFEPLVKLYEDITKWNLKMKITKSNKN